MGYAEISHKAFSRDEPVFFCSLKTTNKNPFLVTLVITAFIFLLNKTPG